MDESLRRRDSELIIVGDKLKEKFVGIDGIIDQFIDSVRVWYLMPELMIRPVIVNLWGLTGSGKTDLVRTFVRLIKMSDSFVELQMDTESYIDKIQSYIEYADIQPDKPSILLLDEMQRFRTVGEDGLEIQRKRLQDVWMLLSDGKFQSASDKKKEIMEILFNDLYYNHNEVVDEGEEPDKPEEATSATSPGGEKKKDARPKKFKYKNSYWTAQRLRKLLNYSGPAEEIMLWDQETKIKKGQEALNNDATFEGVSYSKMLIIIAGNIDEAYSMAGDVSNADIDADIFHEFSKKINVVTIKSALLKRFKPEQVARFGNNHIIYPSLNKTSYKAIIKRNVYDTVNRVYDLNGIRVVPDDSVFSTIYQNGVFPVQGVRPVHSTISSIFDNYIPIFLFKAIENGLDTVSVRYTQDEIIGVVGDETIARKVELSISKIKKEKDINDTVLVSIHEAGHAIVYSLLHKIPPTQMTSITSNINSEGFVGQHRYSGNKKIIKDEMAVCLAGQAAEEIFFGDEMKSTGAASDIQRATALAAYYIRQCGFDGIQSRVIHHTSAHNDTSNTDIERTNVTIEDMVKEAKCLAIDMINDHKPLFREIAKKLIDAGELLPEEIVEMFKKHGETIVNVPINQMVVGNYQEKWNSYIEKT
jgi:cell division protease FtsH